MEKNHHKNKHLTHLIIGAIGIVYGDIGTSPLYTVKECFNDTNLHVNESSIFSILSLILWSITLVVSVKYIFSIIKADNNGEGGILSLTSLILKKKIQDQFRFIFIIGLIGAALFYGDAVLTPAISVLSAVEGMSVYSPTLEQWIIPVTVGTLSALFMIQSKGSTKIGRFFGPAMTIWFIIIAVLGFFQVCQTPRIIYAINPWYGIEFLSTNGLSALGSLSSVVLAITGAEALYADMGHFGRNPIKKAWFFLVFPSLALNYMGQAALIMNNADAVQHPFYFLVPTLCFFPLMIISTVATIIASQAVISGLFSFSWQAIQLGYLPRMRVIHTSAEHIGQVYVPTINKIIMILTIALVLIFKSSDNLASAYGFAVTGIMVITTLLITIIAMQYWEWSMIKIAALFSVFLFVDSIFFSVNTTKIFDDGILPLLIAVGVFIVMYTGTRGRKILSDNILNSGKTIRNFQKKIKRNRCAAGTRHCSLYELNTRKHS